MQYLLGKFLKVTVPKKTLEKYRCTVFSTFLYVHFLEKFFYPTDFLAKEFV